MTYHPPFPPPPQKCFFRLPQVNPVLGLAIMSGEADVRDHKRFCSKAEALKYHISDVFRAEEEPAEGHTAVKNDLQINSVAFGLSGRVREKGTPPTAPTLFQVAWKGKVTGKVFPNGEIELQHSDGPNRYKPEHVLPKLIYGIREISPAVAILSEDAKAAHAAFNPDEGSSSGDVSSGDDASDESDGDSKRKRPSNASPPSAEKRKKKPCLKKTAKPAAKKAERGRKAPEEEIRRVLQRVREDGSSALDDTRDWDAKSMAALLDAYGAYHTKSATSKEMRSAFRRDLDDGLREPCTVPAARPKEACTFKPLLGKTSALSLAVDDEDEDSMDESGAAPRATDSKEHILQKTSSLSSLSSLSMDGLAVGPPSRKDEAHVIADSDDAGDGYMTDKSGEGRAPTAPAKSVTPPLSRTLFPGKHDRRDGHKHDDDDYSDILEPRDGDNHDDDDDLEILDDGDKHDDEDPDIHALVRRKAFSRTGDVLNKCTVKARSLRVESFEYMWPDLGEMRLHPAALEDEADEWQEHVLQSITAQRTTYGLPLQGVYFGRLKGSREGSFTNFWAEKRSGLTVFVPLGLPKGTSWKVKVILSSGEYTWEVGDRDDFQVPAENARSLLHPAGRPAYFLAMQFGDAEHPLPMAIDSPRDVCSVQCANYNLCVFGEHCT